MMGPDHTEPAMPRNETFGTVLLLDIMNSSEYANVLSVKDYYETFLREFNDTVLRAAEMYFRLYPGGAYDATNHYVEVVGDEGRIFLFSDNPGRDVQTALDLAVLIKIAWINGPFNRARIFQNKAPEDLGAGINSGYLYIKKNGQLEGFGINLTKRIESHTRFGSVSKIMLHKTSRSILDRYVTENRIAMRLPVNGKDISLPQHYFFRFAGNIELKGIAQPVPIYELQYINWGDRPFFMESSFIKALAKRSVADFTNILETALSLSVLDTTINNILLFLALMNGDWEKASRVAKTLYEELDNIMEIPLVAAVANINLARGTTKDAARRCLLYGRRWLEIARTIRPHAEQIDELEEILSAFR